MATRLKCKPSPFPYYSTPPFRITNVRETRLAALISHVLILLSAFFLIPNPLQLIPTSVLYGLFLYVAVTSLAGNSLFGRVLLLFTEEVTLPLFIHRISIFRSHSPKTT